MTKLEHQRQVIGRLAPSPSGRMHLGNALAALLAWLSVRSRGGTLVLRMEDLDRSRCNEEKARLLRDDLRWLGLDWDEETEAQSRRDPVYEQALQRLCALGLVYPCWCSRADLLAASAPHATDGHSIYSGACRDLSAEQREQRAGRPAALRLLVPEREFPVEDGLQGRYSEVLSRDCGDFVLRRSDGLFAYQLAVVADDMAAGINEVVRGRDLLSSTPRQLYLYELLGGEPLRYYHTPLLLAEDGRRLSKREADLDLGALRRRMSAEELCGWLGWKLGLLEAAEPVLPAGLLTCFSWDKVRKDDIRLEAAEQALWMRGG